MSVDVAFLVVEVTYRNRKVSPGLSPAGVGRFRDVACAVPATQKSPSARAARRQEPLTS
jgi:hypothetical protein